MLLAELLNKDTVQQLWRINKADIVARHSDYSPNLCGDIAVARILVSTTRWSGTTIENVEGKVAAGVEITEQEDSEYILAQDAYRMIYTWLVGMTGYRPCSDVEGHPEAQGDVVRYYQMVGREEI